MTEGTKGWGRSWGNPEHGKGHEVGALLQTRQVTGRNAIEIREGSSVCVCVCVCVPFLLHSNFHFQSPISASYWPNLIRSQLLRKLGNIPPSRNAEIGKELKGS
jgi:hypothetical protein